MIATLEQKNTDFSVEDSELASSEEFRTELAHLCAEFELL